MIPKKIHYCWFGGNKLPKDVKRCIKSWKKYCPDYEIIKWDETNFDVKQSVFMKAAYENKAWAFVSDYARLKIINDNGGIYLDTDVELLKPLDDLLDEKSYFATQQDSGYINTGLGFGSEPNSKILSELLKDYDNIQFDINKKKSLACPILNTEIFKKHGYNQSTEIVTVLDSTIFPPKYFDPIAPGFDKNLVCKDTYSVHHYNASWASKKTQIKRKIANILGHDNLIRIKKVFKK